MSLCVGVLVEVKETALLPGLFASPSLGSSLSEPSGRAVGALSVGLTRHLQFQSSGVVYAVNEKGEKSIDLSPLLSRRDSNPELKDQNLLCYHYTTRQCQWYLYPFGGKDTTKILISQ